MNVSTRSFLSFFFSSEVNSMYSLRFPVTYKIMVKIIETIKMVLLIISE